MRPVLTVFFFCSENGQITGDVLVYRNPGLHFGDIHIMQATYVEGLESYVGHGKYAIFFPCVGPRSVADEIAGGDFDGDMYWVSKNPQVSLSISVLSLPCVFTRSIHLYLSCDLLDLFVC